MFINFLNAFGSESILSEVPANQSIGFFGGFAFWNCIHG